MSRHRYIVIVLLLLFVVCQEVRAQVGLEEKVSQARLDFAVPEAPAFKILSTEPSIILRPSDPREVALSVADFARSGGVLPKTFAAEFSPAMLIGGPQLTLQQYRDAPFLYRARISAATTRMDGSDFTYASFGLRLTIFDDGDPRFDDSYLKNLSDLALRINRPIAAAVQERPPTSTGRIESSVIDSLSIDQLEQKVVSLRDEQKEKSWYKQLVETGAAARFISSDSLVSRAKVDKYAGWIVASFPISGFGQWIFGGSGTLERGESGRLDSSVVSLSTRIYLGGNDLKAYFEGQIDATDKTPARRSIAAGGEIKLQFGLWLEFVATLQEMGSETSTIETSFKVHWSLPELIPSL